MSSVTDPIRSLQRRMLLVSLVSAAAVIACALWAFIPGAAQSPSLVQLDQPRPEAHAAMESNRPIDSAVFATKLWNPPPVMAVEGSSKPTEPPEPLRPLRLQLIGIIYEGASNRKAAVYDIENDRLLILSDGDQISGQTIKSINEKGIELTDGRTTRTIALKQEPS